MDFDHTLEQLAWEMLAFNRQDPARMQHLLKVHRFAQMIGRREHLDAHTQFVTESAALVHDIGIRPAVERICYLVGHHHTYTDIQGLDYQILVEADFLVNFYESAMPLDAVQGAYDRIFCTQAGKELCRLAYELRPEQPTDCARQG